MALLFYILTLAILSKVIICTPDCYNSSLSSVSKKWNGFKEPLPPGLANYRVDWFTLKPGHNCAFYTFNDIYFASFNANV